MNPECVKSPAEPWKHNAKAPTILVIDDDAEIRYSLVARPLLAGLRRLRGAERGAGGGAWSRRGPFPDLIYLDIRMTGMSGLEALQHIRSANPKQLVILMTAFGTAQTAIEAMKFGALDYVMKPFDPQRVLALAENALKTHADLRAVGEYKPTINTEDYKEGIVGSSPVMQEVFKVIGQVTASDVTVMITGESGTGKELVARSIWKHSHRAGKPFIAVNCAAIPDNLIESELFGHEKGSFTGATGQRIGKFELCDGGTIFLDEIGDMALATQTKILRVLQQGEIQRVGGHRDDQGRRPDHRGDQQGPRGDREDEGLPRGPLLPAERGADQDAARCATASEDIPQIVDFCVQNLVKQKKARTSRVSPEAMAVLTRHVWPGNVRELENVVYRSAVDRPGRRHPGQGPAGRDPGLRRRGGAALRAHARRRPRLRRRAADGGRRAAARPSSSGRSSSGSSRPADGDEAAAAKRLGITKAVLR